jgi:trimethyllysine dioxygenase
MGLQCFHLLHHDGTGGQSLFVDGFKVAKDLLSLYPKSFEILSSIRIQAHSAGDSNVWIQPLPKSGFPVLNLDPVTKELYQIRFNNDDRSPSSGRLMSNSNPGISIQDFYKALKDWMTLLRSPSSELWLPLRPGTLVLFNNWRVLHGRASFTGKRRLCGAYISMDDYKSRVRMVLEKGRDKKWL